PTDATIIPRPRRRQPAQHPPYQEIVALLCPQPPPHSNPGQPHTHQRNSAKNPKITQARSHPATWHAPPTQTQPTTTPQPPPSPRPYSTTTPDPTASTPPTQPHHHPERTATHPSEQKPYQPQTQADHPTPSPSHSA